MPAPRPAATESRLGLTDARGHPLCAAVRPPQVVWSAEDANGPAASGS
ncbi:DUF5990 family protein [Kitasatospora sp. NPDC002551]